MDGDQNTFLADFVQIRIWSMFCIRKSHKCVTQTSKRFTAPDAGTDTQGWVFKMLWSVEPVFVYNRNAWILNGRDFFSSNKTSLNQVPTMTNDQLTALQFGIIREVLLHEVCSLSLCQAVLADWSIVWSKTPAVTYGYLWMDGYLHMDI